MNNSGDDTRPCCTYGDHKVNSVDIVPRLSCFALRASLQSKRNKQQGNRRTTAVKAVGEGLDSTPTIMAHQHMGETVKLVGSMMRLRHNTKFKVSPAALRYFMHFFRGACFCPSSIGFMLLLLPTIATKVDHKMSSRPFADQRLGTANGCGIDVQLQL